MGCPLCDKTTKQIQQPVGQVYQCSYCKSIYGSCYLGDSYRYVKPVFSQSTTPQDEIRYYDLNTIGSKGEERRHGWFNPRDLKIVQVG